MKVYRCCGDAEIESYKSGKKYASLCGDGSNTFNYENGKNYIHFFLFAESVYHYAKNRGGVYTKYFVECDIPFEILRKYYGYGWYERIFPGYYFPVPEFAIPLDEFDINYVNEFSTEFKEEWLKSNDWLLYKSKIPEEYLPHVLYGFSSGFTERSILEIPMEEVIGYMFSEPSKK